MNKYRSGGKTTPKAKVAAKPKAKVAAKPKAKVAAKPKKAYQSGGVAKAKPKASPKASPKAKSDDIGPLTEREKFLIQQAREADMDRKMQEAAARHQKTRLKPKGYARGGGIDQFGRFDPSINRYFQSQPPRQPPRQPMGNNPSTQAPSSFTPQAPSYDKGVVGPGTMPTRQPPRQPPQMPPRLPMGNSLGAGAPAVGFGPKINNLGMGNTPSTRQPPRQPPQMPKIENLGMGMASGRSGRSSSPMNMDRPRRPKRSRRTR